MSGASATRSAISALNAVEGLVAQRVVDDRRVDGPVLAPGHLQHEHVVHVVVRGEALVLRRGDVGVDLHRVAELVGEPRRRSRPAAARCGAGPAAPASSRRPARPAPCRRPPGRRSAAPAPPPRVNDAAGRTAPSLAIRRKGVRRPRSETSSSTARGVEQVGEVRPAARPRATAAARGPSAPRRRPAQGRRRSARAPGRLSTRRLPACGGEPLTRRRRRDPRGRARPRRRRRRRPCPRRCRPDPRGPARRRRQRRRRPCPRRRRPDPRGPAPPRRPRRRRPCRVMSSSSSMLDLRIAERRHGDAGRRSPRFRRPTRRPVPEPSAAPACDRRAPGQWRVGR